MKIFQKYQRIVNYAFDRDESPETSSGSSDGTFGSLRKRLMGHKNLIICSMMSTGSIFLALFIGFEAKTFSEFSEASYTFSTLVMCAIFTRIFHTNQQRIFNLIDDFEKLIEKRESILVIKRKWF